jgi:dihydropteroate synthase
VAAAEAAGVARERIALDAGFGFGKSLNENLEILRRGHELSDFGFPTLSGTSRKSTIGKVLDDAPVEQRQWGTSATVALAIAGSCDMVRVHDVREMAQVARMSDAVVRGHACD